MAQLSKEYTSVCGMVDRPLPIVLDRCKRPHVASPLTARLALAFSRQREYWGTVCGISSWHLTALGCRQTRAS
jgi:hypothetical protein